MSHDEDWQLERSLDRDAEREPSINHRKRQAIPLLPSGSLKAHMQRQEIPIVGEPVTLTVGAVDAAVIGRTLRILAHQQRRRIPDDDAVDRMQRVGDALVEASEPALAPVRR